MSTQQERIDAHNLTNDFQAVHLYSLRNWPDAAWYAPPESSGPYVIMQAGLDPDELGAEPGEFILGRNGHWLPLSAFFRLNWETRNERFFFPTAADAIALMQGLVGRPVVDRFLPVNADPESGRPPGTADHEAFRSAIRVAQP